jgi:hypothetical protein
MLTLLGGALAGFVHVLGGPDHLAAVAPLALADRRQGWRSGWTWGLGHTAGVVCVAVLLVSLRELLPPVAVISAWSERIVGGALIAVGVWTLGRALRIRATQHGHGGAGTHLHLHVDRGPGWLLRLGHAHTAFLLGVLHGAAGSSHLFGVLPALALPTREAALAYIAAFGVGTVAAMTAFGGALGVAGERSAGRQRLHRSLLVSAAVLSILVGTVWLASPIP